MNIETKEPYVGTIAVKKEQIELRKNFGWRFVEDRNHGRSGGLHILFERDKDMKNYDELARLENMYDDLEKKIKHYYPISDSPEMFLLIFCFVFPFLIYLGYKHSQKQEYAEHNAEIRDKMNIVLNKAKKLIEE